MFTNTIEFLLPCSLEECRRRLVTRMDKTSVGIQPVIGHIRGTHLYARRRIWYQNSFQTCLSAKLVDRAGQTLVQCRFSMHPLVMAFVTFWFAGVALIGGTIFVRSLMRLASTNSQTPAGLWLGVSIPVVMIAFGVGLLRFGSHLARDEQTFLLDFVRDAAEQQELVLDRDVPQTNESGPISRSAALASFTAPRLRRAIAERRTPAVLICVALFILWGFGYQTVGLRLGIELNGIVVTRQEIPRTWASHGNGTFYVVHGSDDTDQTYIAGATDGSLPRNIPLGAHITKRRWELSYLLNGKQIRDFPVIFYAIILGGALVTLIWGALQLLRYHD